jgi:hypothetical protein
VGSRLSIAVQFVDVNYLNVVPAPGCAKCQPAHAAEAVDPNPFHL